MTMKQAIPAKLIEVYTPCYSGPNRSGTCICGHGWREHHLGIVMNPLYREATGEAYIPEECEHFGFNEMGGRDAEGKPHCDRYQDSMK